MRLEMLSQLVVARVHVCDVFFSFAISDALLNMYTRNMKKGMHRQR